MPPAGRTSWCGLDLTYLSLTTLQVKKDDNILFLSCFSKLDVYTQNIWEVSVQISVGDMVSAVTLVIHPPHQDSLMVLQGG